jgi:hypothetical protein
LFLEYFGLRSLEDLPAADELRRVPVKKPESLLTVDPGLATAPPEQLKVEPAAAEDDVEPGASSDARAGSDAGAPPAPSQSS